MENFIGLLEKINRSRSPIITLVSLGLLLGTSFYTSRATTAAIERTMEKIDDRVSAIELDRRSVPQWREDTTVLKEQVRIFGEDIKEVKQDVKDIRNFLLVK